MERTEVRPSVPPVVVVPEEAKHAGHRDATVRTLASRIAVLRGSSVIDYPPASLPSCGCYAVPVGTLVGSRIASYLGILSETDLFGGLVPYAVQAGKAITHSLVEDDAARPEGWSADFARAVRHVTLAGYSAFDRNSAHKAATRLLTDGPVRLKAAWADGGQAQRVIRERGALEPALDALDTPELARCGLVIEPDLHETRTYSIGRVRIGDAVLAYIGWQHTTPDNAGASAYGGSVLAAVAGEFDRLRHLPLDEPARQALQCALTYDEAASTHFPGLIASRRNYDVVSGRDATGALRIAVLEQSWRIGGASGAEIAAFEAFSAAPGLAAVRASCHERYGRVHEVPPDSFVYFDADDPEVGPLIKYARIEARHRAL
ncbi:DUF3182 family protein [Starkeya nomas]|nr:DUF3182 family protein [Starkeya nomas]